MKSSLMYVSLAMHFVLSSAMHGHQMKPRQEVNSTESDPMSLYLWRMCSPDTFSYVNGFNADGQVFPHLASSPLPCDQADYILNSCMANATDPAVDFAAEQQCLCGSNLIDAWKGCQACYHAHGARLTNEDEEAIYISSIFSAECAPSPYPTVPFGNFFNITTPTTTMPWITLEEDKFPNQTAASNYWTTNAHVTPTIGVITGIATGRASLRTEAWEYYTPPGSLSSSSGTAAIMSSPITIPIPIRSGSASGSATGATTSLSTAGAGDHGVASGVVLIVVNVVAVMLL